MERLTRRIVVARRALASLKEVSIIERPNTIERDASIQRFEYTVEASWKAAQAVLDERFGIALASPEAGHPCLRPEWPIVRSRRPRGDGYDRRPQSNYNEAVAIAIHSRIGGHAELLGRWLDSLAAA